MVGDVHMEETEARPMFLPLADIMTDLQIEKMRNAAMNSQRLTTPSDRSS